MDLMGHLFQRRNTSILLLRQQSRKSTTCLIFLLRGMNGRAPLKAFSRLGQNPELIAQVIALSSTSMNLPNSLYFHCNSIDFTLIFEQSNSQRQSVSGPVMQMKRHSLVNSNRSYCNLQQY